MTLQERLVDEMKEAMRSGQAAKLSVIRMLRSTLKNREIDRGKDKPLTDQDVLDVIQSGIKQRRESIEQFRQAGRTELVAKEDEEIAILQTFLPAQLSAADLDALVRDVAAEVGASSVKDMGKVMKAVMARVAGRAEGGAVSAAVKRTLERLPPP
ncbi:MAG: GatB/YqeY domain-containing protein [Nitrospirota bacterium]